MSNKGKGFSVKREELLKLLNKYGFYSNRKEPFLYEGKEGVGICYQIKDPFYGVLTRVFLPDTIDTCETFLKNYYDYKKNEKNINVYLNDYKIKTPSVTFEDKEQPIEELKIDEPTTLEQNYIKKLKRTLNILLQIIDEKIKIQNTTYQNLIRLTNEYIGKQNELNLLLSKDKKNEKPLELLKEEPLENPSLEEWKQVTEENDLKILEESIYTLIDFIKNLEKDEGLLKNKYELVKLPIKIRVISEKIEFINKEKQKKKGLFAKKENMEEELRKIEDQSPLKNIVTFEHYKTNELSRIEEKYAVIPDLDIRTIGDYIVEFDNLKIVEPIMEEKKEVVEEKQEEIEYSFESVMENLENSYQKRTKEEQELLVSYFYLTKHIVEEDSKTIEEFLNKLKNPNNIMIQVKYFKNMDLTNPTSCLESIKKIYERVNELEKTPLLNSINVFFKSQKKVNPKTFLKTSSKRILSPIQSIGDNDCAFIAEVEKNVEVLFIPEEITTDLNDDTLQLKKDTPYLLIDLEKNKLDDENSDIIRVVDYEVEKKCEDKLTIITDLKSKKVNLYKKVGIRKDNS